MVLSIVKTVGGLVASVGASGIVANVIRATQPANVGALMKCATFEGGVALGGIAANAASEYAEVQIETVATKITEMAANKK